MRDILADADAAAEAADFSSTARSLQLDTITIPVASGMPKDPAELREVFELAMKWLYTRRLPTFFEFEAEGSVDAEVERSGESPPSQPPGPRARHGGVRAAGMGFSSPGAPHRR